MNNLYYFDFLNEIYIILWNVSQQSAKNTKQGWLLTLYSKIQTQ